MFVDTIYRKKFSLKKRKTELIKERIGLNWKPIVTFRNHIHKLTQYYFIDTNAGNGFG